MSAEPEVPAAPRGEDQRLDPRAIPLQKSIAAIVAAVVAAGSGIFAIASLADNGPSPLSVAATIMLWLIGNGLFAWHGQRWQAIDYQHTWYRVDDGGIEIRRGVFWREVINVPRSRVQHTDVSQGPLERKHGLGTLVVYTAGTQHSEVKLPGLEFATAQRIRAHLLPHDEGDAV